MVASRASCRRSSNTTIILGSSACNSIPELKSRPFAARCSRPLSAQRWSRAGWCRADRQPFFPQNNIAAIKIAAQHVQMNSLVVAFAILGAILLGAISPGPSFVLVARTAVALSRRDALAMALGMGVGGVIFAGSALLGLMVILASVPWIYIAIKVAGAFYLLYLALSLWKSANHSAKTEDMRQDSGRGMFRSFAVGLMTQLSNPKTAIWYASIFTVLLVGGPTARARRYASPDDLCDRGRLVCTGRGRFFFCGPSPPLSPSEAVCRPSCGRSDGSARPGALIGSKISPSEGRKLQCEQAPPLEYRRRTAVPDSPASIRN